MRDCYDDPRIEDLLDEQYARLPDGPLGFVKPPTVDVTSVLPSRAIEIVCAFLRSKIDSSGMVRELNALRQKETVRAESK